MKYKYLKSGLSILLAGMMALTSPSASLTTQSVLAAGTEASTEADLVSESPGESAGEKETQQETSAPPQTEVKQAESAAVPQTEAKQTESAAAPQTEAKQAESAAVPQTEAKQAESAAVPQTEAKQTESAAVLQTEAKQTESAAASQTESHQKETAFSQREAKQTEASTVSKLEYSADHVSVAVTRKDGKPFGEGISVSFPKADEKKLKEALQEYLGFQAPSVILKASVTDKDGRQVSGDYEFLYTLDVPQLIKAAGAEGAEVKVYACDEKMKITELSPDLAKATYDRNRILVRTSGKSPWYAVCVYSGKNNKTEGAETESEPSPAGGAETESEPSPADGEETESESSSADGEEHGTGPETESEIEVKEKGFRYEHFRIAVPKTGIIADLADGNLGSDVSFALSAENTGDIPASSAEVRLSMKIPDSVLLPDRLTVSEDGTKIVGPDLTAYLGLQDSTPEDHTSFRFEDVTVVPPEDQSSGAAGTISFTFIVQDSGQSADGIFETESDILDGLHLVLHGTEWKLAEKPEDEIEETESTEEKEPGSDETETEEIISGESKPAPEYILAERGQDTVFLSGSAAFLAAEEYGPVVLEDEESAGILTASPSAKRIPVRKSSSSHPPKDDFSASGYIGQRGKNVGMLPEDVTDTIVHVKEGNMEYHGYKEHNGIYEGSNTAKSKDIYMIRKKGAICNGKYVDMKIYTWADEPYDVRSNYIESYLEKRIHNFVHYEIHFLDHDTQKPVRFTGSLYIQDLDYTSQGYESFSVPKDQMIAWYEEPDRDTSMPERVYMVDDIIKGYYTAISTLYTNESEDGSKNNAYPNQNLTICFKTGKDGIAHFIYDSMGNFTVEIGSNVSDLIYGFTDDSQLKTPSLLPDNQKIANYGYTTPDSYGQKWGYEATGWFLDKAGKKKAPDIIKHDDTSPVHLYVRYVKTTGYLNVKKTISDQSGPDFDRSGVTYGSIKWNFSLEGSKDKLSVTGQGTSADSWELTGGTYHVSETGADQNLWVVSPPGGADVKVTRDRTSTAAFLNSVKLGSITIYKTIEGGEYYKTKPDLSGFVFHVSGTSLYGHTISHDYTTDASGTILIGNVPLGQYTVSEAGTPDSGTSVSDAWSAEGPKTAAVSAGAPDASVSFSNRIKTGSILITKTVDNPEYYPKGRTDLSGFRFRVHGTGRLGYPYDQTFSTDAKGQIFIPKIPFGAYYVDEVSTPDGENSITENWTVSGVSPYPVTVVSENEPAKASGVNHVSLGKICIHKIIENPTEFERRPEEFHFHVFGTSNLGYTLDTSVTTDSAGNAVVENVPYGTYTVQETGTPDQKDRIGAMWKVEPVAQNVTVSKAVPEASVSQKNIYRSGHVKVVKTVEQVDKTQYNWNSETDRGQEPRYSEVRSGFAFRLFGTSDGGDSVDQYALTDDGGIAMFRNIPVGKYTVSEVSSDQVKSAASGNVYAKKLAESGQEIQDLRRYVRNPDQQVTVDFDNSSDLQKTSEVSFENKLVVWRGTYHKVDDALLLPGKAQGAATLQGAVYGLYDGREKNAKLVASYTTDEKGSFTTGYHILGDSWYLHEIRASEGYLANPKWYHISASVDDVDNSVLKHDGIRLSDAELPDAAAVTEPVRRGKIRFYKVAGDTNETDELWLKGAGFSIYSLEVYNARYGFSFPADPGNTDDADDIVQSAIDHVRDSGSQSYSGIIGLQTASVYVKPDDPDVAAEKLVKSYQYKNGKSVSVSGKNEYLVPELFTGDDGIINTPRLPYGRYLLVETTVPKGKTAVAPRVITIDHDDRDQEISGDGSGTGYLDFVLWDKDLTAYIRITKKDSVTGKTVAREGAQYVLHDAEGAYFRWYMKDRTTKEKERYRKLFGDLVVDLHSGSGKKGSYENPLSTVRQRDDGNGYTTTYIETPQLLPEGTYVLEEVKAPDKYVRQGSEGLYREKDGKRFWEIESTGEEHFSWTHITPSQDDVGQWTVNSTKASKGSRVLAVVNDSAAVYDPAVAAFIVPVTQSNDPAVGKISVYAEGEYLTGFRTDRNQGTFEYTVSGIPGSRFVVKAAEDIYSNEGDPNAALLFGKGDTVTTLTTGADGKAYSEEIVTRKNAYTYYGLPVGKYTIEEIVAGEGFSLSRENTAPRNFEITYQGENVPITYRDIAYSNPRQKVKLGIAKYDRDTEKKVDGAIFGLYAAEDISGKDGNVLIKADTLIGLSEAKEGKADFPTPYIVDGRKTDDGGLPLAHYYVKEVHPPKGYTTTDKHVDIIAGYDESQAAQVKFENEKYGDPYMLENQQIMVVLKVLDADTDVELDGAEFIITEKESGDPLSYVSVHNGGLALKGLSPEKEYLITETKPRSGYSSEIFLTGEKYRSPYVAAGTYRYSNKDWKPVTDIHPEQTDTCTASFKVNDAGGMQILTIINKSSKADLTVHKEGEVAKTKVKDGRADTITYHVKGLPGAEYDLTAAEDIAHPDGYSGDVQKKGDVIGHRKTDKEGNAGFDGLWPGTYTLKETKAPEGYTRKAKEATRTVDLRDYQKKEYSDKKQYPETFECTVTYKNDRQKIILVPPEDPPTTPGDPDHPPVTPEPDPHHDYGKGMVGLLKLGIDDNKDAPAAGAQFTLYAQEDVRDIFGNVTIPKGTEIEKAFTGKDGYARFRSDLPIGIYKVRETGHPQGYYSSDAEIVMDLTRDKENDQIYFIGGGGMIRNPVTKLVLLLKDNLTDNELADSVLTITDPAGKTVRTVTTAVTGGTGIIVKGLDPGITYTITETKARAGYLDSILNKDGSHMGQDNHIQFSLSDSSVDEKLSNIPEVRKITMYNAFVTGDITVAKKGEVLTGIDTRTDRRNLNEKHMEYSAAEPQYQLQNMKGAQFAVYAAEDIRHPDGVTGILFRKGELVKQNVRTAPTDAVGYTDDNGDLYFRGLYLGKYTIRETNLIAGYAANQTEFSAELRYKDADTPMVLAMEGIAKYINRKQKVKLTVVKKDAESKQPVSGAVFGLYAAENLRSDDGTVIVRADTLLITEQAKTGGMAVFDAELPPAKYYVMELSAPSGYTRSSDKVTVDAQWQEDGKDVIDITKDFEDETTKVEIVKYAAGSEEILKGAHLQVTDAYGKTVDSWTSGDRHLIKGLAAGHEYTLKETAPVPGYATSPDVKFVVRDRDEDGTYKVQEVKMEDAPVIIKIIAIDKKTKKTVDGVKVDLYDQNGKRIAKNVSLTYLKEKIPVGTYTVNVKKVPAGYRKPEDTTITVADTAELQVFTIPLEKKDPVRKDHSPSSQNQGNPQQSIPASPRTGDDFDPVPLVTLAILALLAIIITLLLLRQRRKEI